MTNETQPDVPGTFIDDAWLHAPEPDEYQALLKRAQLLLADRFSGAAVREALAVEIDELLGRAMRYESERFEPKETPVFVCITARSQDEANQQYQELLDSGTLPMNQQIQTYIRIKP